MATLCHLALITKNAEEDARSWKEDEEETKEECDEGSQRRSGGKIYECL